MYWTMKYNIYLQYKVAEDGNTRVKPKHLKTELIKFHHTML